MSTFSTKVETPTAYRYVSHRGFSDESSWNQNRYRSIGLVTAPTDIAVSTEKTVASALKGSEVREFAWKELTTAKRRFAAEKIINHIVELACSEQLRVDVLIWDTHDARHRIMGRDDTANLARMYYHLMANVMRDRWPRDALWIQYVDKRTDIDWRELEQCLAGRTRREREVAQTGLFVSTGTYIHPPKVEQASSGDHVLIQVADLFAGMSAFSWNEAQNHGEWLASQSGQLRLMPQCSNVSISRSARPKHEVLQHLVSRLPYVYLKTTEGEGLRTYAPFQPINFWRYIPQGEFDRAPLRNES